MEYRKIYYASEVMKNPNYKRIKKYLNLKNDKHKVNKK